MSRFDFKRFYDELEEGDPGKFPFWLWFAHETFSMFALAIAWFLGGIVWSIITTFTVLNLLKDTTFFQDLVAWWFLNYR